MTDKEKTPQAGRIFIDDDENALYYIDPAGNRINLEIGEEDLRRLPEEDREQWRAGKIPPKKLLSYVVRSFLELSTIEEARDNLKPISDLFDEIEELEPFLSAELKKPEYGGIPIANMECTPAQLLELRRDPNSFYTKAVEAARAAKESAHIGTAKSAKKIDFPLDKPNANLWKLLDEGSRQITFDMLPKKKAREAYIFYSIDFDALTGAAITKKLRPFDKLVYTAISSLFNAGNNVVSLSQIYYAMGYKGTPGAGDRAKINDSITKMNSAKITLDTTKEHAVLKNMPLYKYDGQLLPMERVTALINGKISEAAIHIFREPPLITFAKERKQITTIDVELLQSPLSKTDTNIQIQDYLLERISREKHKGKTCTILLETLYRETNTTTKKQKQRATPKITILLEYFQEKKFIKGYTLEEKKIIIQF